MDLTLEAEVRVAAMAWLDECVAKHGDVLDQTLLKAGFEFRGRRVQLWVQQGIHKPKFLDAALSVRTALDSPYSDEFEDDSTLVYRYRGSDPRSWDNRAARLAFEHRLPLIYLHAVDKARYAVVYPVFIEADDQLALSFTLRAGLGSWIADSRERADHGSSADAANPIPRAYATRLVLARLHQATFRERVLRAYRQQCAMCRLRHPKLLDAAHIVPDSILRGEPIVSNGLSLCRIHHGAFDIHYIAIEPASYRVRVSRELLEEEDGPMLQHGLKELEGVRIQLPRKITDRPDPERLRHHWERFCEAG